MLVRITEVVESPSGPTYKWAGQFDARALAGLAHHLTGRTDFRSGPAPMVGWMAGPESDSIHIPSRWP